MANNYGCDVKIVIVDEEYKSLRVYSLCDAIIFRLVEILSL